jgi:predicted Zn finger-like uncharacterized protein
MIIICDKCNKKFRVKDNLIPKNGRLLKCGNCENSWYFKISNESDHLDNSDINKDTTNQNFENQIIINKNINKKINKNIRSSVNKNNKGDFFKYFLNYFVVILILFVSIIIVADTFKIQISLMLPGIIPLLDNLYATLFDLQLFIKDLFN